MPFSTAVRGPEPRVDSVALRTCARVCINIYNSSNENLGLAHLETAFCAPYSGIAFFIVVPLAAWFYALRFFFV